MHDPSTVAFDIKRPWPHKSSGIPGYRYFPTLFTIWHNDPERDGSDDSCGWFMRARHGDKATLKRIEDAFAFEWDSSKMSWFDPSGTPQMSTPSIVLDMFMRAAQQVYTRRWHDKHGWRGAERFCRRHLMDILRFAGNGTDSFHTTIEQTYGRDEDRGTPESRRQNRIEECAAIVYGCILRWSRPWYRHPRWHIHHWSFQVPILQTLHRWLFQRCAVCSSGFAWGEQVYGNWGGDRIWHFGCDSSTKVPPA